MTFKKSRQRYATFLVSTCLFHFGAFETLSVSAQQLAPSRQTLNPQGARNGQQVTNRQPNNRQADVQRQSPNAQQALIKRQPNLMVQAAPFPLTPEEKERVDQLLEFWEYSSNKVQTYSTRFERIEFDPVFGPKDPNTPKTQGMGTIRYSAPDKGEFKLESLGVYTPPTTPGAKPQYPQKPVEFDEHWICDGLSVFEFNSKAKQLIETKLPPEMQGQRIADGPLPFMFGAKKDELKQRYWIREMKNSKPGQYSLTVYPKRRDDAMNYSRVSVIIAESDFLPHALVTYPPNHHAKMNPARTVYVFKDRQVNKPLHRGQQFFNRFVSPKPPIGWKKVVSNAGQAPATIDGQPPRATATKPRSTANRPEPTPQNAR